MTDTEKNTDAPQPSPHKGARVTRSFDLAQGTIEADVIADWLDLHDKDKETPVARIFHTAYLAKGAERDRPVVFCINGGPGASSIFLHFACAGPVKVPRNDEGKFDTARRTFETEKHSWLNFADLVFIDPVGTGFSHKIPSDDKKDAEPSQKPGDETNPYWATKGDLDSIGQFMRRFLREHKLWHRPLYFAGESYGGYRACRLARRLNADYGLGMDGIISISPIWQFRDADESEFSTSQWINVLPTYAAIAHKHGISQHFPSSMEQTEVLQQAEQFALGDYTRMLVSGKLMPDDERHSILSTVAAMTGLPADYVVKAGGRVPIQDFARMVRQEHHEIVDLYDGSQTTLDPFPHRTSNETAIETSMFPDMHVFQTVLNLWFFEELGVDTPLEYKPLNMDVLKHWKNDEKQFDLFELTTSLDDFRAGMALHNTQRALIVHGRYDTVTPYFASKRLLNQANLDETVQARIEERLYEGGHMFYSWPDVNAHFARDVQWFVEQPQDSE